jgi:hypothetical protein
MPLIFGVVSTGVGMTGFDANVTFADFAVLPTVAVTVAVPTVDAVSVAVATPFVVIRITVCAFPSVNVPSVVRNSTAVPFGTGAPFSVTVAVTTEVESTTGFGFDTVMVMLAPVVGGVVPPVLVVGGVVDVDGAVGDSPLHPPKMSTSAATPNKYL